MKKISLFLLFALVLAIIRVTSLPWNHWAYQVIQNELTKRGIQAEFTIERFQPGILVLRNITIQDISTPFELLDVRYVAKDLLDKKFTVQYFLLRSKDGEVSTKDVSLDFSRPLAASATLSIQNVPLSLLMKLLTAGKADATGVVSGILPLTLHEDGTITVKQGKLNAGNAGTIIVNPEAIPGDNEQVDVVRNVMKNFHYQTFSMILDSDKDKKLSMLLQLYGNNPDVYNGREVKLNVHLRGDVLNFLQQTVLSIGDPKAFLEQINEKNN